MSRLRVVSMLVSLRFPRVSGDEPAEAKTQDGQT